MLLAAARRPRGRPVDPRVRRRPGAPPQLGLHPPPVVLKDSSPGQLAVYVNVSLGGYDASTRDGILITVNFQHDGRQVKFVAGEHVTAVRLH